VDILWIHEIDITDMNIYLCERYGRFGVNDIECPGDIHIYHWGISFFGAKIHKGKEIRCYLGMMTKHSCSIKEEAACHQQNQISA
jgi:hypothetical protein